MAGLGLLDAFKQYLRDAAPGGALNPEQSPQSLLDMAATASIPVPIAGDALGLLADANRYRTDPSSRTWGNYGLSALGALPLVPAMSSIKVFHGSPHKFDKFDLSKMGSGEGAQAYGHGGYFAESPAVAKSYTTPPKQSSGVLPNSTGDAAKYWLENSGGDVKAALRKFKQFANDAGLTSEETRAVREAIAQKNGNIYEGLLRWPDAAREAKDPLGPQHFLDWDKPINEAVLKSLGNDDVARATINQWVRRDWPTDAVPTGARLHEVMTEKLGSKEMASKFLRDSGIPGITYLDAGSRAAGEGTRNYVAFSDDLIELLKRNGQPLK